MNLIVMASCCDAVRASRPALSCIADRKVDMKVSELTGAQIDFWVAKAEGWKCKVDVVFAGRHEGQTACQVWVEPTEKMHGYNVPYLPSSEWYYGGPIIERERIGFSELLNGDWSARIKTSTGPWGEGKTHLIAAMRAFVASKYGDEVPDIPTQN